VRKGRDERGGEGGGGGGTGGILGGWDLDRRAGGGGGGEREGGGGKDCQPSLALPRGEKEIEGKECREEKEFHAAGKKSYPTGGRKKGKRKVFHSFLFCFVLI